MTLAELQTRYAEKRSIIFDMFEHELIDNDVAKATINKLEQEYALESDWYSFIDTLPIAAAA